MKREPVQSTAAAKARKGKRAGRPQPQPGPAAAARPLAVQFRELIAGAGLNTNALAKAAGVPQPVLHHFLSGQREDIRLSTADKLCAYFGVQLTKPRRKPAR